MHTTAQTAQRYVAPLQVDTSLFTKIKSVVPIVDKLFTDYTQEKKYPSLVYGILLQGKLIATGAIGKSNISKNIDAKATQSMYRIASMSKSVTALCIMQLRDAGRLKLDDPAWKYIPELRQNKLLTTDAPAITIRHLLSHTAGFPEDNPWGDRQLADSKADLINLIKKGTYFANVPGNTYEYSNLGFALLGAIVENISGLPLERYTKEKIFRPLGMNNTEWEYTKVPSEKLALGYRLLHGEWKEEELLHHGSYGAMGGLITSIEDFSKYIALHMDAWPARSDRENTIIKRSSLREMHMPAVLSGFNPKYKYPSGRECGVVSAYNFGLNYLRDCEGREYVGHSGGLPGFGSQWRFLPNYGLGIVSFANLTYAGTTAINLAALDTIIRLTGMKPVAYPESDILKERKNQLVRLLPDWDETSIQSQPLFAENFFPDRSIDDWRLESQALFQEIGTIQSIEPLIPLNQLRGTFTIHGDKGSIAVFFTLTPENKPLIQELNISKLK